MFNNTKQFWTSVTWYQIKTKFCSVMITNNFLLLYLLARTIIIALILAVKFLFHDASLNRVECVVTLLGVSKSLCGQVIQSTLENCVFSSLLSKRC